MINAMNHPDELNQQSDYFNMSNSRIRLCQFHSSDKHKCFFCWRSTPNPNEEVLNFAHLLLMFGVSSNLDVYFATFDAESRASKI